MGKIWPFGKGNSPQSAEGDYYTQPAMPFGLDSGEDVHPQFWGDPERDTLAQELFSGEFDLSKAEGRRKVRRIISLQRTVGQSWEVIKMSKLAAGDDGPGTWGMKHLPITSYPFFPTSEHIWNDLGGDWGGGTYQIRAKTRPMEIFISYTFPGDGKNPKTRPGRQEKSKPLDEQVQAASVQAALDAMKTNPEAMAAFGQAVLYKTAGLAVPKAVTKKEQSLGQQLLAEAAENDPDLRAELIEMAREELFGKKKRAGEPDDTDKMLKEIQKYERIAAAFGFSKSKGKEDGEGSILGEVMRDLAKSGQLGTIITNVVGAFQQRGGGEAQSIPATRQLEGQSQSRQQAPRQLPPASKQQVIIPASQNIIPAAPQSEPLPIQPVQVQPTVQAATPTPIPSVQPASLTLPQSTQGVNWLALIGSLDWDALEVGIRGDAREFVQGVHAAAYGQGDEAAVMLVELLRDNQPQTLWESIRGVIPQAKSVMAKVMMGQAHGKVVGILEGLGTDAGLEWLVVACATAQVYKRDVEAGGKEAGFVLEVNPVDGREMGEIDEAPFS